MKNIAQFLKGFVRGPSEAPAVTPAALLMPLEPRIVYDASVAAVGAASHHHHVNLAESAASRGDVSESAAEMFRNSAAARAIAGSHESETAASAKQVVFVDPNVTDYQSLLTGLPPGTRYVVLNPNTDGLEQIAQYLQSHPGVDSIALLSHGSEAQVEVGGTVLDLGDLSAYSAELGQIGAAMKPGGDFAIYACEVAEGSDGQALVQQIASLSHLNVAASTSLVGATALGGSWTLDYDVGTVREPVVFSTASEQRYGYLLSQTIEDYTANPTFDSGNVNAFTLDGITYTITKSNGASDNQIFQDPTLQGLPDENSSDNSLLFDAGGTGGTTAIKITLANGDAFSLSSLDIDVTANVNVTFTANTAATANPLVSDGSTTSTTVSFGSSFNDITSLTIAGGNLEVNLGHIVYTVLSPPVVATSGGTTNYERGAAATTIDSGVTVTDSSATTQASGTVSISGGFHSGDTLSFTNTSAALYGNISVASYNAGTGVLSLTSSGATATNAQWRNVLDAVTFSSTSTTNGNRTISFSTNDGTQSSNTATDTVDVTAPPVVTTSGGTTDYESGASATAVDSGVTLTDGSHSTEASGTATISSGAATGDTLAFTNTSATLYGNISASFSGAVLTLTSSGATATTAQWTNALDSISFSTTSTTTGDRTISFAVNDGTVSSAVATKTVDVTAAPVVTTSGGTTGYESRASATTVDSGLTLTDGSHSTEASATATISSGAAIGDTLLFTNTSATLYGNISASFSGAVLTLTSSGATATTAQWTNALDSISFSTTSSTTGNRTISFVVNDGTVSSTAATKTVDVTAPPIVTTSGGATEYDTGTSATAVDSGVTLTDGSASTEASATATISSGVASGDTLAFSNTSATLYGNISASFSGAVLTLTSSGATATTAQWTNALEAIAFSTTSSTLGNRTISFVVNDGTVSSVAATKTVDVMNPLAVTADSGSASFVAGDNTASTPVAIDSGLTVTDTSTSVLQTATVSITGNFHSGEDVLAFTNTNGTTFGNISASYSAPTGVLTLNSSGNTATLAQWQAALDAVTYTDTAVTPNNATRTFSFSVTDANSNVSNTATRTVTVTDTDQTPIVTTTGGTTNYVGGSAAVPIDSSVSVSDLDNTTQVSGTISISSGFHSGDTLAFTNTSSSLYGNINASYNSATGVLTLSSSGATATDAQWANAFSAAKFSAGVSAPPGNRTVSFVVNDGTENSVAATDTVDVTGPPTVTTDSGSASFVAGDNTASTPVTIDSGLTVSDGSTSVLLSATVSITGNFHSGEDVLAFTNTNGTTFGNISASYSAPTGVLTLNSSGNTATLAQWQAALDAVTYTDTAVTPNNATRTFSFSVTDASSNVSNTATRTVTVTDTDQTPIVTATGGTTNYIAGTTATPIDAGVTVSDRDNPTQASGTVEISGGFSSGDTLAFTNTNSTTFGNITASYNSGTGVLTLTSTGVTATDAQWANAFDSVTFSSSSSSYGNRTVSFVVSDGSENSAAATKTVAMIAPPAISTDSGSAAFVAGDNVTSTPVTIDSGATVADAGSSTLQSATVSITGNFHSGEDVLAFTNNGSTMGNIAGSYNATTGLLTLSSSGATATTAQWNAVLDSVTYTDTAITPNTATRTISFNVVDGNSTNSNTATRTVIVADTDQTPIVTTTGGTTNYIGGSAATTIDSGVTVSDRDNPTQSSGTAAISSGFESGDTLGFTNTSASLYGNISASYNSTTGVLTLTSSGATATDTQWSNAFDAVAFSAGTNTVPGNRTISFVVNDGTGNSAAATDTVDVISPPTVTTDSGSAAFVAGDNVTSTPVTIDSGATVTDAGSSTLQSATVSITGNFHSGEDVLAFTNNGSSMGNIAGSYNATTGVLTLSSAGATATTAQWSAALDSVTYTDTAITPNTATRTVSFSVTDGNSTVSNVATRTVTVADTDQTPIVVTTSGTASYVGGAAASTVDGGVTVTDRDNPTLSSATVSISGGFNTGDTLAFSNSSSATYGNIGASYNATTGVLTLTSSGSTATDAQWQRALESITFSSGSATVPGNRTISFVINDGTESSAAATRTVAVITPPSLVTDSGSSSFVAADNATSLPIVVDSGITVADAGSSVLATATVAVTGNFHSGEDVLSFANNGSTMGNVSGSYNATTGVLTLTSSGSTATLAQWQSALQSVTYTDTAVTPNNAIRTISFSVSDGNGNGSNAAIRTVTVQDTDQTPVVVTTGGVTTYQAGPSATTIDSGITVSDRGNTPLASATVSIGAGFHSGDELSLSPGGAAARGNITAAYDASTGVLTLSSSGATATLSQWQSALDAVQFSSPTTAPAGSRTISFVVSDRTDVSVVATKTVDVVNITFVPARMPLPVVEPTPVSDQSLATTDQDSALIVLTALDSQASISAGDAFRLPAPLLSSPVDLVGPIDIDSPIEPLEASSEQPFSLSIASPAGGDIDADAMSVEAMEQVDGSPLPPWIHYDTATGVLHGTPPAGASGEIRIFVWIRHSSGATTRQEVVIDVSAQGKPSSHGVRTQPHAPHAALHSAKPSLTEQFNRQRSALHVSPLSRTTRPNPVA